MTVESFFATLRMVLGDTRKVKYSDEHLIESLNLVLSMASDILADCNHYVTKDNMTLKTGDNYLPANFSKLVGFDTTVKYSLLGSKITVDKDCKMEYFYVLPQITSTTDNFPLPDTFKEAMINYIISFLNGTSVPEVKQIMNVDLTRKATGNYIIEFPMPFNL